MGAAGISCDNGSYFLFFYSMLVIINSLLMLVIINSLLFGICY